MLLLKVTNVITGDQKMPKMGQGQNGPKGKKASAAGARSKPA